jgi:hypothetical protein
MLVDGKRILTMRHQPVQWSWRGSRPPNAGDIAQARLFDNILQDEIAELRELA